MNAQRPYFVDSTPDQKRMMCLFVGGNFLLMLLCGAYVVATFTAAGVTWPTILATVLVGWFIADFASGLVHWSVDTWFDEASLGRAVAITREHHTHPQHVLGYGFLEHSALGSAPSLVFIGLAALLTALFPVSAVTWCLMVVWLITATCLFFGMSFHNLAHKPSRSAVIRFAQATRLLIRPEEHWVHHDGDHAIRYCVISGWANHLCDPLRLWRRLEWLVGGLTGAEPHRDDRAWRQRYEETGTLLSPPP
jgi:ubiquitin-conjugating enzyme E2 variant